MKKQLYIWFSILLKPIPILVILSNLYCTKPTIKPLSDLTITDIWKEDSLICYQIRNIGQTLAIKDHGTALLIDGERRDIHYEDIALKPGERRNGSFNYIWQPSQKEHELIIKSDFKNIVTEVSVR